MRAVSSFSAITQRGFTVLVSQMTASGVPELIRFMAELGRSSSVPMELFRCV